nr:MAG TPA: hypothetical protein [Caudoviricetes sp.]
MSAYRHILSKHTAQGSSRCPPLFLQFCYKRSFSFLFPPFMLHYP